MPPRVSLAGRRCVGASCWPRSWASRLSLYGLALAALGPPTPRCRHLSHLDCVSAAPPPPTVAPVDAAFVGEKNSSVSLLTIGRRSSLSSTGPAWWQKFPLKTGPAAGVASGELDGGGGGGAFTEGLRTTTQ